jgi:hypothetical protein
MVTRTEKSTYRPRYGQLVVLAAMLMSTSLTGCTAIFSPIDTIPVSRVPPCFLAEPQADKVPIDVSRLRQTKPDFYTLDADDVLGVFIEGVLGNFEEAPPVQLPSPDSDCHPRLVFLFLCVRMAPCHYHW